MQGTFGSELFFGQCVSLSHSGDTVALSGMGRVVEISDPDQYYFRIKVYKEMNGDWTQHGQSIDGIHLSEFTNDARAEVSLNGDGTKLAISTVYSSSRSTSTAVGAGGCVLVYELLNNKWVLLSTPYEESAGGGGALVGLKVSLNNSGSRVAIGEQYFDERNSDDANDQGRILVCNIVSVGKNCSIVVKGQQSGDHVGSSVMIAGDIDCVIFGSTGSDSNGANSGSASVYCLAEDVWTPRGSDLKGEKASDEFGSSVAITSDGTYVAVGATKNAPDQHSIDAGHVRVFKYDKFTNSYYQIGSDIDGERGASSVFAYYAGDLSGFSLALSDEIDNILTVAVGAPNNEGDGGYYDGHVRVFKCDVTSSPLTWVQIGYDIVGQTLRESAGYSIAMSRDGMRAIVGSPEFGSKEPFVGVARVYENIDRHFPTLSPSTKPSMNPSPGPSMNPTSIPSVTASSQPSSQPSTNPSPDPTMNPTSIPSVTASSQPSSQPSTNPSPGPSMDPTSIPSVTASSQPSSSPSTNPTSSPSVSATPTSEYDRLFRITTRFEGFDSNYRWCLSAREMSDILTYKRTFQVRLCEPFNRNQLWSTDQYGQLKLAIYPRETLCMVSTSRFVELDTCDFGEIPHDRKRFNLDQIQGRIVQYKYDKVFLVGFDTDFDMENESSAVRLFQEGLPNESLIAWSFDSIHTPSLRGSK